MKIFVNKSSLESDFFNVLIIFFQIKNLYVKYIDQLIEFLTHLELNL